ncbi:M50 family metallopeptidase [Thalassotalea ponticola]|uniref:M50 family metallopeptidase n=1 Tax=Thalassotalea ponticola TaxID=1523392 RepID=UPI0025B3DF82|nr:M50 family metallopeptidase [Thalassotalea ponticola]MDN3651296.1 M50 family metallopeptidase [Thalassotalea ponticola]
MNKSLKSSVTSQSSSTNSLLLSIFTNTYTLLLLAIVIKYLPVISVPFDWLESYFHEISHGLAALVSGGQIVQIQLFPNGAGLCTTRGGNPFLISVSGYLGATVWALLIFWSAGAHHRIAKLFNYLILLTLLISMIFWVSDLLTWGICLLLIALFSFSAKIRHLKLLKAVLQLIALSVVLNAIRSPLYLFGYGDVGDANALANLTLMPEFIWIFAWTAVGLYALYQMLRIKS